MTTATGIPRSAADHAPAELTFLDCDERTNVVRYSAPSASRPGRTNTVSLDVLAWAASCDCTAGREGRPCRHVAHVAAAFDQHPARVLARSYTDGQLATAGRRAARHCAIYRRRTWRTPSRDVVALVACRLEYADRRAAAGATARVAA